jgi:hypothetical protein
MRCHRWPLAEPFLVRFPLVVTLLVFAALAGVASQRVRLTPHFLSGQTLRYQIDSRDVTTGQTTAPIANPEGGSHSTQTIHMLIRLDVIAADTSIPGAVRIRATCEKSGAQSQGDALDLGAADADEHYNRMEGHSLDFVLQPSGQVTGVQGADPFFADRSSAADLLSWLGKVSYGNVPRTGVSIGEKWKTERPLADLPLSGLTWRTDSTYLRNEPCSSGIPSGQSSPPAPSGGGECAVFVTHFQIFRRGSATADATPEDYRRNGLRTSGKWSGSGESSDSIALSSGLLVSSTQTSIQDLDYQITGSATKSTLHQRGTTESHSLITLLPDSNAAH